MLNLVSCFIYLFCLGAFAWIHTDRTKPVPWLIVNAVWFLGMVAVSYFFHNVYVVLGIVSAIVAMVRLFLAGKTPLNTVSNLFDYGKLALVHFCFFPVLDFEEVYVALKNKV